MAIFPFEYQEKFVRISYLNTTELFAVENQAIEKGFVVVSSLSFKAADNKLVTVVPVSNATVLIDEVKKSKKTKVAFLGLLIAIAGLIIDACLDIGEKGEVIFDTSESMLNIARYSSWALKIIGLLMVALKGLLTGEKIAL